MSRCVEAGDRGQRYEILYIERESGEEKVFGWIQTEDGAKRMVDAVKHWPSASDARYRDRQEASNAAP